MLIPVGARDHEKRGEGRELETDERARENERAAREQGSPSLTGPIAHGEQQIYGVRMMIGSAMGKHRRRHTQWEIRHGSGNLANGRNGHNTYRNPIVSVAEKGQLVSERNLLLRATERFISLISIDYRLIRRLPYTWLVPNG